MGLDAFVRCRCLEKGKLREPPVPIEDIYVDEDGELASRTLDGAYARLGYRRFQARYGALERTLWEWFEHPCEHERGEYCHERVSNVAGVARFDSLVAYLGGEKVFPLLSNLLPDSNGGCYPASLARATLAELDRFTVLAASARMWGLLVEGDEEPVWTCAHGSSFGWVWTPRQAISFEDGDIVVSGPGAMEVRTRHFMLEPPSLDDLATGAEAIMRCLDQGVSVPLAQALPPARPGAKTQECLEYHVEDMRAPFLHEGTYPTAERLKNLLRASIETGNPITWT